MQFDDKQYKKNKSEELVDIDDLNSEILLDIIYATANNISGIKLYKTPKCYLRKFVAEELYKVQKELEKMELGLKIYDGFRPLRVQKIFCDMVDPPYVAPLEKSRHPRGTVIDLTLVDSNGIELPMPTAFDAFSQKAHYDCSDLPQNVIKNRQILQDVMVKHNFLPSPYEWWHFDYRGWENYSVIDFDF